MIRDQNSHAIHRTRAFHPCTSVDADPTRARTSCVAPGAGDGNDAPCLVHGRSAPYCPCPPGSQSSVGRVGAASPGRAAPRGFRSRLITEADGIPLPLAAIGGASSSGENKDFVCPSPTEPFPGEKNRADDERIHEGEPAQRKDLSAASECPERSPPHQLSTPVTRLAGIQRAAEETRPVNWACEGPCRAGASFRGGRKRRSDPANTTPAWRPGRARGRTALSAPARIAPRAS